MHWGYKLMFVFIVFALLIGTLVYKSMHTKFELVSADYYKDELNYQDKINGTQHANQLGIVHVSQSDTQILLQLPADSSHASMSGNIWFYCATNASLDRHIPINAAAGAIQSIDKRLLAKTNYTLKISWQYGATNCYAEKYIQIH